MSLTSQCGSFFKGFLLKAVTVPGGKTVGCFMKIISVLEDASEDGEEAGAKTKDSKAAAKYLECAGSRVGWILSLILSRINQIGSVKNCCQTIIFHFSLP